MLERDEFKCHLCKQRATQVHHLSYGDVTILGTFIDKLISICPGCHRFIEFTKGTKKRPPQKATFKQMKRQMKKRKKFLKRRGRI